MSNVLLDVQNITMQFGGLKAVDSLSFQVKKGELAGLIGPNGAGKTTVFNMLTGVYKPKHGNIIFDGVNIADHKPHEISFLGITRTFQNIRLFKNLTVLDNVKIGFHQHLMYSISDVFFLNSKFKEQEEKIHEKSIQLLKLFNLESKALNPSSSLPYGEQRKLEIIRALATDPKLILLDEPAAGMNHSETYNLMETIARIRNEFNLTILLIEHDMKLVMGICENIFVLDHGVKIEEGSAAKVQTSNKVIEAYLGVDA